MKSKPFMLLVLTILLAQPIVIISSIGNLPTISGMEPSTAPAIAQDVGTRLLPEEHTDHVPILIDGDTDFDLQGWPGEGTDGNPFIISGLNITYDYPDYLIKITNVDAHFIIEDCYLRQLSSSGGMLLENVTHATINYITVLSDSGGIEVNNAPSTYIHYALVESSGDYALQVNSATDLNLYHSIYNSSSYSAVWINASESAVIGQSIFDSAFPYTDLLISYSDYVSLSDSEFHISSIELYLTNCNSFYASNLLATEGDYGIQMYNCNDTFVSNLDITSDYDAMTISTCDNITVTDSTFSSNLGSQAIGVSLSSLVSFYNIFVNDTHNQAIKFTNCDTISVTNSLFTNIPGECIWLTNTPDSGIISNTFEAISDTSIAMTSNSHRGNVSENIANDVADFFYAASSDNGTFSHNTISTTNDAFSSQSSSMWEIHDNQMEDGNFGILLQGGSQSDIWNNEISMFTYGFHEESHGLVELWNNTISNGTIGIELLGGDEHDVRDNVIFDEGIGIWIDTTENSTVETNIITDCAASGIYLVGVVTSEFIGNNISDCVRDGIYFISGTYNIFNDNNLDGCGFNFLAEPTSIQQFNHSFSGNLVNGLPLYYAISETLLSIDGYSWGQIILINCTYSTVSNGLFDSCTTAVQINYGHDIDIMGLDCYDLWMPIYSQYAENVSILWCDIIGNNDQNGIFLWASDYAIVESCNFTGTGGDWLGDDCTIKIGDFNDFTITDCNFRDLSGYAIGASDGFITSGSYGEIIDCTFVNASAAIYAYNAHYLNVTGNDMLWCDYGIFSEISDDWRVEWNNIHDCGTGIYRDASNDWLTANNTIDWNNIGIQLYGSFTPGITADNIIALNFMNNGVDDQARFWDDGIDTGNYWDDWDGSGAYDVGGSGGAQDRYPMHYEVTEPIINTPQDIWMAEGSVGNTITWLPFDDSLKDWFVEADGDPFVSGIWEFDAIEVNIDSLAYGNHTVFIEVFDVDMNSVNDTVIVHVYDDTPPEIDGPADSWFFVDATGQTLEWDVSDLNPDTYSLTVDGVEAQTGSWATGVLSLNMDDIDEGEHTLVLTIYDVDGNSVSDTVLIRVIEDNDDPTITAANDVTYIVGATGNVVEWDAEDDYPASYEVSFNGTVVKEGAWGGSTIVFNVDGLDVGTYEYTLTVYDMSGNSGTSSVNVTVIPTIPPDLPLEIDLVLLLSVGAVAGGAVVVVGVIYYFRKTKVE